MSFFRTISRALTSPLVRGASAVAGLASGFGAFKDMGNVPGLNIRPETAIGALNVASGVTGLATGRGGTGLNLAQLGLGGFNVLQNNQIAGFGGDNLTFQDVARGKMGAPTTTPSSQLASQISLERGGSLNMNAMNVNAPGTVNGVPIMQGVEPMAGAGSATTAARVTGDPSARYTVGGAARGGWSGAASAAVPRAPADFTAGSMDFGDVAPVAGNAPVVQAPTQAPDSTVMDFGGSGTDPNWMPRTPAIAAPDQPTVRLDLPGVDPTLNPETGDFTEGTVVPRAPDSTITDFGGSGTDGFERFSTGGTITAQTTGQIPVDPNSPAARMGVTQTRDGRQLNQADWEAMRAGRGLPAAPTQAGTPNAAPPVPQGATPEAKGNWYNRVFDKMLDNPAMTVVAGSMLVSLMQDDQGKAAADEYAARVAATRAQIDPSSSFAQEYKANYQLTRQNKLDEEYEKMIADYESKMSARGMLDSTVYTEGLSSIRQNYLRIKSEIPAEANDAYLRYAQGLAGATSATLAPDAQVAAMRIQTGANSQPNFAATGMALGQVSKRV